MAWGEITEYTEMLREIDATSLRGIRLSYFGPGALFIQEIEDLFRTIRERCSPSVLRSIEIQADDMDLAKGVLTMATIKPLLPFSNLEVLDIDIERNVGFDLDNESVELFVPAWPHMESLEFRLSLGDSDPKITLDGLIPIARSWANLERLAICLTATTRCGDHLLGIDNFFSNSCCFKIRSLDIRDSPIPFQPQVVAAVLQRLFPNFHGIIRHGSRSDEGWSSVSSTLRERVRV